MAFYFKRAWHSLPPGAKGSTLLDPQPELPKPRFRPGFWVLFSDPSLAQYGPEHVGRVKYAEATGTGRERWYEIEHGPSQYRVPEARIVARMARGEDR